MEIPTIMKNIILIIIKGDNYMKIVALILLLSCLQDIIVPSRKVFKAYFKAKKDKLNVNQVNLNQFYKAECLNITALIFF